MLNITIVSSGRIPHIGGKSTHIMDLKDGFEELGHNVQIISESSISVLVINLSRLILLPLRVINKYRYTHCMKIFRARYLARLCQKLKSDVIIAQDAPIASALCESKNLADIPKYLTMHTYFGIENRLDGKDMSDKIYTDMLEYELKCLDGVDGIVCVDKRIRKSVEDIIAERNKKNIYGKVSDISNFTNTHKFKPVDIETKNKLREKYNVEKNDFVCVCARRLVEKNGVIYAARAMDRLEGNYILLIAGEGSEKERIEQYVREHNLQKKVRFLNSIPNQSINELYQLADVSLVPSVTAQGLQEATSITAIEGMSCGVPTVASNIGGLAQLIENDKTGILTNEGDEASVAEAVTRLKENTELYSFVSNGAREYIENNHSHVQVAKKYLNVYKEYEKGGTK